MKIFICYSSKDRDIAEKIHRDLELHSHKVFFDQKSIIAGEAFEEIIYERIKASDAFIFLISPDSTKEGSYTLTELNNAIKTFGELRGRIIPAIIQETELEKIPPYLKNLHMIPLTEDISSEICRVMARLDKKIKQQQEEQIQQQAEQQRLSKQQDAKHKTLRLSLISAGILAIIIFTIPILLSKPKLIIYSGQEGAAYHDIGELLGNHIMKSDIGKSFDSVLTIPTAGGVENCEKLEEKKDRNDIEIGLFQLAAYNTHCFKGELQIIAPLYDEITHFVLRKKNL